MLHVDNSVDFSREVIKLISHEEKVITFISQHSFACLWIWDSLHPDKLVVDYRFSNLFDTTEKYTNSPFGVFLEKQLMECIGQEEDRISISIVYNENPGDVESQVYTTHFFPIRRTDGTGVKFIGGIEQQALSNENALMIRDTKVKQLNKLLNDKQLLLEQILQNLPINIYIKDRELKKTLANRAELDFCGMETLADVVGKSDYDIYNLETAINAEAEDRMVIENKNFQIHKEVKFSKKDGTEVWLYSTKVPLLDENENVIGILGSTIDITERKKNQLAIDFQSRLLELIGDVVIATDNYGIISFWNKAAENVFDWKRDEVLMRNIFELSAFERLPLEIHEMLNETYDESRWNGLFKVKTKYNKFVTVKIRSTAIRDTAGNVIGIVGIGNQVDEIIATQEKLRKTSDFLFRAEELAEVGAWDVDISTNKVQWSSITKEIHNVPSDYQPELAEAINFYKEGMYRDIVSTAVNKAINTGEQFDFESIIITTDGRERWVRANCKPIMVKGKCVSLYGSIQDITERKLQHFEIQKKQLLLETLSSQVPVILFQFKLDTDGRFSWPYISERSKDIYELAPEEYYQNPNILVQNTDPLYIQPLFEAIQQSAHNLTPFVFESKTYSKSGKEKWILTESIPQKQEDGSIVWSGYSQDITLRKHAEMELDSTKNKLESILNSISEVVWSIDPVTGKLFFISPSFEQLYGLDLSEIEKNSELWKTTVLEDDYHIMMNNYDKLARMGEFSSEYRIRNAETGEIKWTSQSGRYIYNEIGEPIRIDGITKDITEKKIQELELARSESKFRSYVENAPNIIFTHDLKGKINYIFENSQAEKLGSLGERRNVKDLIHPDDLDIALTPLNDLIKNKVSITSPPFRIKSVNNQWEWRVVNGAPLLDEAGQITEVLAILTNVNTLIEKEQALTIEKAKANKLATHYQSLLDNESVFVVKTDINGYFTFVNEGHKIAFGAESSKIGTHSLDSICEEDKDICREVAMKCIDQPEIYHKVILRKPTVSGEIKIGTWEFIGKRNDRGRVEEILCIGYDITELNKLLEDTRNLLRLNADQNNRLQNFTYIISHNLRSHSANMQGLIKLMEENEDEDEKGILFEMLKLSTERLEDTIKNLNEIITIKKGINTPKEGRNIREEIYKTLDILLDVINVSKAKIVVDIPDDLIVQVIPAYLDSIILNILGNAIKYRSPERNCEIVIMHQKIKNYVVISFKDNGMGMDMKLVKDKIFGMYKTFHKNADARGIGLFLTKNQLEAMNSKIEVESKLNVGSTFKVYFYDGI